MKFNKSNIEKITPPAVNSEGKSTRVFYYDDALPQLGLTVTSFGSKSYHVRATVSGRTKRVGIPRGKFPDMTAAQARQAARLMLGDIAKGLNPVQVRREERHEEAKQQAKDITLRSALTAYLAIKKRKANTTITYWADINSSYSEYLDKPVSDITQNVVKRVNRERQVAGSGGVRVLKALFNWLKAEYKSQGIFQGENPTIIVNEVREVHKYTGATGFIKKTALAPWFDAVDELDTVYREYYLFLLMTGVRADTEAASLTWDQIDWREKTFTLLNTKNGSDVELPIPAYLYPALKVRKGKPNDKVFPITGAAATQRKKVTKASGVKFTRHDLRRTFLTIGASVNVAFVHIKRLANHIDDANDITLRYIQTEMDDLHKASKAVETFILSHANRLNSDVIPIDTASA